MSKTRFFTTVLCAGLLLFFFTFNPQIFELPKTTEAFEVTPSQGENMAYKRLVNPADGYTLLYPHSLTLDTTHAAFSITAADEAFSLTVSKEYSPYEDMDEYIAYYQNRLYTDEDFLTDNGFVKEEDTTLTAAGCKTRVITLSQQTPNGGLPYSTYTFAYQYTGGRHFIRYLFKGTAFSQAYQAQYQAILASYVPLVSVGTNNSDFAPQFTLPSHLDEKTRALLERLQQQDRLDWGIFVPDVFQEGIHKTIPALEAKLERPFDVVLMYQGFGAPFLREGMEEAKRQGKLIEYTLQISSFNNENIFGYSPMFDVAAGNRDEDIRALAREINDFGDPLLFRLNNEMNSDWTSYSGIVTLSDPQIYIQVWQRIYNIFKEEGVTNTLWIFNPNDRNYPPVNWNHFTHYYPGDEYVQLLGITGYNTGNYYQEVTGEYWRSFPHIYDSIETSFSPYFSQFPWIITEFSSSSYGGDKVAWIEEMFRCLPNYERIKIAVWFSYADYDFREGQQDIPSRPYWLDETPETLEAFKKGFAKPPQIYQNGTAQD